MGRILQFGIHERKLQFDAIADSKFDGPKSEMLHESIITPDMVANKSVTMNKNKSLRVDDITPNILKETACILHTSCKRA